jgi:predicted hotdog family 3-hydroxylacyl-ACP dehydratase
LVCYVDRLDLVAGSLLIEIERLQGDNARAIYSFGVHGTGQVVLTGRAAVVLENLAA